jgi:N4-gp56 family major capsid protein
MSRRLYMASVEDAHFVPFAKPVDGFGKNRGESVQLIRVQNITEPGDATLNEQTRIPIDTFSLSNVTITVSEYGRGCEYTSLSLDLSEYDLENPIQMKLKSQMTLTLDTAAAVAFRAAQVKYIPTGVTARTINTNGTTADAAANVNIWHIEEISDYMWDTLNCPKYAGDDYVAIFRTLGLRGIKRDPLWDEWHKYVTPEAKATGEVGRIEAIRFIQTNHNNALRKLTGTGSTDLLGEGVVFGQDAVALAEAITPQLRAAIPQDYGRQRGVAWYGVLKFGIIWDTGSQGEARIVHVTSTD